MTTTHLHSETPWRIGGRDGRAWTITDEASTHAAFPVIFGLNGNRVANIDSHEEESCDANAAFIVMAVNNHAALLEAAKAIESAMSLADFPSSESVAAMNAIEQLRPQLKAAIAAAEQKRGHHDHESLYRLL